MIKYQISDYIGKRYGYLTVVGQTQNSKTGHAFDFKCDCGNIVSFPPYRVFTTGQKSCGKCKYSHSQKIPIDISKYLNKHNNKLTVIGLCPKKSSDKHYYLECLCDCGNKTKVTPYQFKSGAVKSCGCLLKTSPNRIDGRGKHELYGIWCQMIYRCEKPNHHKYHDYGERGITVCSEWHDFWNFVKWSDSVGGRPDGTSLDRIDVNGNYEPSNCRWADSKTQSLNKRSNRLITYNGVSKPLHQWATDLNISDQSLSKRIQKGWSLEKALTLPPQKVNQFSSIKG
jgi:hypothetical protein|nr:MAG TPA: PVL ORF-50-like family [Bacteriophage sp.]